MNVLLFIVIILFVALAIRIPIAFAMILCSLVFFWLTNTSVLIIPQRFFSGLNSFTLLALPLFICTGYLMETAGISRRLIDFSSAIVGHIRGGLGLVNVLTSMFFAGMSGSAVADTAAIGSILIPGMIERGYPPNFSAAITASSSSIGIIVPPSIPMILFSVASGTSVAALFAAGYIPGLLVGLSQMFVVYCFAKKYNYPIENNFSWRRLLITLKDSALPLLIPIIIIGGLVFGVVTPTEAGLLAFIVALLTAIIYRAMNLKLLYKVLLQGALSSSVVCIIIMASNVFAWILTHERIPHEIASRLIAISDNKTVLLLILATVLIPIGSLFHAVPMIFIFVPIIMPAITALNIPPVQFGMVFILAVAIGQQTPPVASALYITSLLAKVDVISITRVNIWFILCLAFVMYLVIFVPNISLYIPRILGWV